MSAQIDRRWIDEAVCVSEFVAAVIDQLRVVMKRGSKSEQRRELLGRTSVHGSLLPLLDSGSEGAIDPQKKTDPGRGRLSC